HLAVEFAVEFLYSSRRRHTSSKRDWSSDVCASDLQRRARASSPGTHRRAGAIQHGAPAVRYHRRPRSPGAAADRDRVYPDAGEEIGRASCRERVKIMMTRWTL